MGRLTMGFGAVLVRIGVVGYVAAGTASVTALIPDFIGVPMTVAGWLVARPNLRAVELYSALVLAVLMALGSLRSLAGVLGGDFSGAYVI
jgi:hypothetical protein